MAEFMLTLDLSIVNVALPSVADADAVFAQAVAAGAEVRQPLQDMFWGDRNGQLDDPFGHRCGPDRCACQSSADPLRNHG